MRRATSGATLEEVLMKSQSSGEALGFVVMLGFMCSVDTV